MYPSGGGRRKNKRSSSSAAASPSSSNTVTRVIYNNLHALSASVSFSNVLPTFMSTGFKFSLPLAPPLSLSSSLAPSPALAPGGSTMTTPSFMDILRGGFLHHHQSNSSFYGPTPSGGDGMETSLPPSFGFGVMQPSVVDDQHGEASINGGSATATTQWVGTQQGHNNDNVSATGSDGLGQRQPPEQWWEYVRQKGRRPHLNPHNCNGGRLDVCREEEALSGMDDNFSWPTVEAHDVTN
ncbi:hypothetical protein EJB05_53763, partial [Eragrostis curvula]